MKKSAGCLVKNGDRFLLIRRSQTDDRWPGLWEMPAGQMGVRETPEEAAVRETREETGLNVKIIKPLGTHKILIGEKKTFYCFLTEASGQVKLSYEHDAFKWVTKKEALAMAKVGHHTHYFLKKL